MGLWEELLKKNENKMDRVRKGYWLLNIEYFVSCDDVKVNLNFVDNGVIPTLY
jgi:hypothetical protein